MTAFLSDVEIADICRPLRQPAAQIRFLVNLGLRVRRRPDGTPLVLRTDVVEHNARPTQGPRWTK